MSEKAIFLDRDGVLVNNSAHYYIWKKEQLEYVEGAFENLKFISSMGYKIFIVSNQGGISRGLYTKNDILILHKEMNQTFQENGIEIQEISFCPHHSELEKCLCRKPDSLIIEKLIAKYHLRKEESYFVGDSESDIQAAKKAGIKGIKITPNQNMYPFIAFLNK
ncbi:MAG: HAD family hydrolase [Prolixibacteraceae bacterium]|jgi:D-glycero-D-manno-heptose 1,7-bisphosphate phosphatase